MTDLIERAKAALEGATPGPWVAIHTGVYANYKGPHQPICEPVGIFHCPDRAQQKGEPCRGYADSGLIALAPDLARALIDTTAERDALRERVAKLEAENARIKQGLFQSGQRFHAVVRTDSEKSQIDAACNKWAWECHEIAGTSPAVPHPLLEEVRPQALTALQKDTPNE